MLLSAPTVLNMQSAGRIYRQDLQECIMFCYLRFEISFDFV